MEWLTLGFIIESIMMGVALAMDAFSVSLTNGLNDPHMKKPKMCLIAGVFCFFQILMPLVGWVCVHTIAEEFAAFHKFIPWIALILLLYIGGKMLIEGLRDRREEKNNSPSDSSKKESGSRLTFTALLVQGIATSIDALSTGFTIADYGFAGALTESLIIGLVTFIICVIGLILGKKIGVRLTWKASVLGGVILICIGLKIFIEGVIL